MTICSIFKKAVSCESDTLLAAHLFAALSLSLLRRDLCTAFGKDVLKLVEARPMIHELLTEGRRSKTNKTKTLATWATKELRKLKNQAW